MTDENHNSEEKEHCFSHWISTDPL